MASNEEIIRKIAAYRLLRSAERRYSQVLRVAFAAIDANDEAKVERLEAVRIRILERISKRMARFHSNE